MTDQRERERERERDDLLDAGTECTSTTVLGSSGTLYTLHPSSTTAIHTHTEYGVPYGVP